tara:strand:- start:157 stop:966 length:810 start_codon:yes stop_codon:yes gene_type:complete
MLYKIIYFIFQLFPGLRKWFWKKWYTVLANKANDPDLRFMNYGYFSEELSLTLNKEDEKDRYSIQLYHHVASQIDLKGLKVLEVGSGRGGGSAYISKYLDVSEMFGVDISPTAVELCNKIYNINNLTFKLGDSENLPFDDNTFDAIVNIESSHCYASMSNFLKEAKRVLKPGGSFLFCDLRRKEYLEEMLKTINTNGFKVIEKKDITPNIIEASIKMTHARKEAIKNLKVESWFKKILESFAATDGSKVHQSFKDGYMKYYSAYCQVDK